MGHVVPIDFTVGSNKSPSRKSYILGVADVPGGARVLEKEPVESADAAGLV